VTAASRATFAPMRFSAYALLLICCHSNDRIVAGQELVYRFATPAAIAAVRDHVAKGGAGQEIEALRGMLKDFDKRAK